MQRHLRLPLDLLVHGLSYGALNFLIDNPEPLDGQQVWDRLTGPERPLRRWLRESWPPPVVRRMVLQRAARMEMAAAIPEHYDVSNEFYRLFLDDRFIFYSCADHLTGSESLVEAQQTKAEFIFDLLDPKPEERILDLGCGWGSMLRFVAERTGAPESLVGYTLSREQAEHLAAYPDLDVRLRDFVGEDHGTGTYDKIYSIAAWEAIRPSEADALLARLFRALAPGGRFVLHFFCRLRDALPAAASTAQLFFPGHVPLSYRQHVQSFERAGFRIVHTSCHDYRDTLRQWFENLMAHADEARELVGTRVLNRYTVFFPASYRYFDDRVGVVFRFVLQKPA